MFCLITENWYIKLVVLSQTCLIAFHKISIENIFIDKNVTYINPLLAQRIFCIWYLPITSPVFNLSRFNVVWFDGDIKYVLCCSSEKKLTKPYRWDNLVKGERLLMYQIWYAGRKSANVFIILISHLFPSLYCIKENIIRNESIKSLGKHLLFFPASRFVLCIHLRVNMSLSQLATFFCFASLSSHNCNIIVSLIPILKKRTLNECMAAHRNMRLWTVTAKQNVALMNFISSWYSTFEGCKKGKYVCTNYIRLDFLFKTTMLDIFLNV